MVSVIVLVNVFVECAIGESFWVSNEELSVWCEMLLDELVIEFTDSVSIAGYNRTL